MFSRREWLRSISAVSAIGLSVGFAGCGGDGGNSERTPTQTTEGNLEEAQSRYDDAIEDLVENHETIMDWAEGRTAQRDRQAIQTLRDNIERARSSLDDADEVAPEDYVAQIGHARDVASLQEAIAAYHEALVDFQASLSDGQSFADSEQNERAIEQYREAKEHLDDARDRLADVEAAHERLDSEALDEPDLDYSSRYTRYLDIQAPGTLDAVELSVDGQIHLNQAFVELNAGDQHYQAEEFTEARQRFEAGAEALQQSEEAYTAVQEHEHAYDNLRQDAIQILGLLEDLQEAFDRFVDGAQEAEAGNPQEANELMQEGFEILGQAFEE